MKNISTRLLSWHFNLALCEQQGKSSPPSQISEEILSKKFNLKHFLPARLWLLLCHCPLNIAAAVDIKRNNDETHKKETLRRNIARLSRFDKFLINYKNFCAFGKYFAGL